MEILAAQVRRLVYTIICFQCLLQLTEGSAYQKYLKLFSYLLTLCICCNVIFSFVGNMEESLCNADTLYKTWEKEWQRLIDENGYMEEIGESGENFGTSEATD